MYKLVVPKDVRELIRTMHPSLKKKVKASLKIILSEPYSGKALMDELSGLRSFGSVLLGSSIESKTLSG